MSFRGITSAIAGIEVTLRYLLRLQDSNMPFTITASLGARKSCPSGGAPWGRTRKDIQPVGSALIRKRRSIDLDEMRSYARQLSFRDSSPVVALCTSEKRAVVLKMLAQLAFSGLNAAVINDFAASKCEVWYFQILGCKWITLLSEELTRTIANWNVF